MVSNTSIFPIQELCYKRSVFFFLEFVKVQVDDPPVSERLHELLQLAFIEGQHRHGGTHPVPKFVLKGPKKSKSFANFKTS